MRSDRVHSTAPVGCSSAALPIASPFLAAEWILALVPARRSRSVHPTGSRRSGVAEPCCRRPGVNYVAGNDLHGGAVAMRPSPLMGSRQLRTSDVDIQIYGNAAALAARHAAGVGSERYPRLLDGANNLLPFEGFDFR